MKKRAHYSGVAYGALWRWFAYRNDSCRNMGGGHTGVVESSSRKKSLILPIVKQNATALPPEFKRLQIGELYKWNKSMISRIASLFIEEGLIEKKPTPGCSCWLRI